MGWQDREYASDEQYRHISGRRGSLIPTNWQVSTILLIVNVGLFLIASPRSPLFAGMVLNGELVCHGQVWRILTACFLHWYPGHLMFNMLALYFFGPALEGLWGRKKFLLVYLLAGIVANAVFVVLYVMGWAAAQGYAAGASGCIYAILGALAVVLPHLRILLFFVIPMNIRTFLVLFGGYGLYKAVTLGANAGGEAVHLAGIAMGLGFAYWDRHHGGTGPRIRAPKIRHGTWQKKLDEEKEFQGKVDHLLAKIKNEGIGSLSDREKKFLADASRKQQEEEGRDGRTDRL